MPTPKKPGKRRTSKGAAIGVARDIDIRALRIFSAVAASGNMTAAAAALSMTQSAVSQIVNQLEHSLGVRLIDRGWRPLKLTAAGSILLLRAESILQQTDALRSAVREASTARLPQVRIGLVDSFCGTAGASFVKRMINEATHIEIWGDLATSLGQAFTSRRLDMIITSDPLDEHDGLNRCVLWREPFVLAVPRQFADEMTRLSLQDLARRYPLIRFTGRSHLGGQVERYLRRSRIMADRRIEFDTPDAVVATIAAELGWAITTPLCLLQSKEELGKLRVLKLPGPRFDRVLTLICRMGEFEQFFERAAQCAKDTLREECLPRAVELWPWLSADISVPASLKRTG